MNGFLQLFDDPHARHAMLVHAPIILGSLGVLPLAFLAATRFRNTALKLFCITWFAIASLGAALAANAGEEAESRAEHGAVRLTPAAAELLHEHEELGEGGWKWPLIPGALVALTLIPAGKPRGEGAKAKRPIQIGAGALAIAASLGVGVWVALTAHAGGELVYVHGVGVPQQTGGPAIAQDGVPPAARPDDDGDDD